jgi:hypothetical protein
LRFREWVAASAEDEVQDGAPEDGTRAQADEQTDAGVALLLLGEKGVANGRQGGLLVLLHVHLGEDGLHVDLDGGLVVLVRRGLVLVCHVQRFHGGLCCEWVVCFYMVPSRGVEPLCHTPGKADLPGPFLVTLERSGAPSPF